MKASTKTTTVLHLDEEEVQTLFELLDEVRHLHLDSVAHSILVGALQEALKEAGAVSGWRLIPSRG